MVAESRTCRAGRRGSKATAACIAVALVGATAGCVTVKPYERAELAKPEMDPATDALEDSFYSHVESAREGGFGGCGCG